VSESLNNVGGMANTNQQTGQGNAALGFLLGRQFKKKNSRDGGSSSQDYENRAELERHKSQLRMDEKAHAANIRDEELSRSYDIDGTGEGHIHHRGRAIRETSEYTDPTTGAVIGEVPLNDSRMGISTGGFRPPAAAPTPAAKAAKKGAAGATTPASTTGTTPPAAAPGSPIGQQMRPIVPGAGMVVAQNIPVLTASNSALTPGTPGRRAKNKALKVSTGITPTGKAAGAALQEQAALQESQANPANAGTGRRAKPWSGND
jgi:hypothetical protein